MSYININTLFLRFFVILASLLMLGFICATSFEEIGFEEFVWIEAENPKTIEGSLKVVDLPEASEGKGILMDPISSAPGKAIYEFYISKSGYYTLWARCYWDNVCANKFLYTIDNAPVGILGENPIVYEWHWLSPETLYLEEGDHKLTLWSGEPDAKVDKFLLTSNSNYTPSGFGSSLDKFYDFENRNLSGFLFSDSLKWEIVEKGTANLGLYAKPVLNSPAGASVQVDKMKNYTTQFIYLPDSSNYHFRLIIEMADPSHYNLIEFNNHSVFLYTVSDNKKVEVGRFEELHFDPNSYCHVSIKRDDDYLHMKYNGKSLISKNVIAFPSAFSLNVLTAGITFDNISIVENRKFSTVSENFHFTGVSISKIKPENRSDYFSIFKSGKQNWWGMEGEWKVLEDGFEAIEGMPEEGESDALLVFGNDYFMSDYYLKFATRINGKGAIGIRFFVQDEDNFYLFRWDNDQDDKGSCIITKWIEGKEHFLAKRASDVLSPGYANWSRVNIKASYGDIKIFVDDLFMLETADTTFRNGKVALWTNVKEGASFDDIEISPISEEKSNLSENSLYFKAFDIANSYSYWRPNTDHTIQMEKIEHETGWSEYFNYLHKPLFEVSTIRFRKILKSDFQFFASTNVIPPDINIGYKVVAYLGQKELVYYLEITDSGIFIKRNGEILKSISTAPSSKRRKTQVSHYNGTWTVKANEIDSIQYSENLNFDSLNFSINYSGIGTNKIFFQQLSLDEH